ncbi:hypothetical protein O181_060470 [Austropuccinia psidii MF-1]|uniref:Uncharacterized protein n=1 Tax=Austropuccinia psidii MF-1 TaxID=1389203 RepID=A0A9Q3EDE4_9BASI|nr:hypothetical protein [Austropuccinia psidii MF-1]
MLVMLANKHTTNACLLSDPSDHVARGVPDQDALARTPLWSTMMKAFLSGNGYQEQFWTISPVPSSIDLSTIKCLTRKKTPRQPTPGPSGTQWLEDLFREPSQTDEPPIPGLSPSLEPHEDALTREPEPEVAPTQSMEEPFACPTPPHSVITINDTPVGSSPHSHDDTCQEFTNLRPTLIIPQIHQPNLVGAFPIAPHYSLCGCNSLK